MDQINIAKSEELPEELIRQFSLFGNRFREFWSNWESLKEQGISFGGHFSNKGNGAVDGPGCGVEKHRLKGYYLDYRFFHAKKEQTHLHKICNLIGRYFQDELVYKVMADLKEQWNHAGILHEWHGIAADQMIDALFNGELFHYDEEKAQGADRIHELLGNDLAHHCLSFCVYDRMLVVRNLNWIITPLVQGEDHIRIPKTAK